MTERDPNLESTTTIANGADRSVPTARVGGAASGRGGATRWGIALVIVALVVGVGAAGAFLLAGSSSPSTVLAYAPADAVSYAEVRFDLPGDQRQNLGSFLSRFPGFDDQANLETKLDEALDRIVRGATHDEHDYSSDLKPWFGGQIGVAVGPPPASADPSAVEKTPVLAAVTVTDAAAARAWFADAIADQPHSTDSYNGVELTVGGDAGEGAMAIVDDTVMLLGTVETVRAAIDSDGQGGLATADWFRTARAALGDDDRVGAVYVDSAGYLDWLERVAANAPGTELESALDPSMLERVPAWMAGELRVEGDALAFDAVTPHVAAGPDHANRLSEVADRIPASAVAAVDVHDVGAGVTDVLDQLRADPGTKAQLEQLDQTIAMLGGWESLVGWIGDAAVVVTADGNVPRGGIVVAPTEPEAGTRFLTQLRGMIALGGSSLGVSVRDEDHGGTTISYLELGAVVGEDVPEVAFAATDDVVVLGVGDFVESVLDVDDGSSLADSERYRAAIERVGGESFASFFVDVAAVRGLAETLGAEDPDFARYETEIKPYLEPFDVLVGASRHGGEVDRSTMLVTVK